jgi:hypothetical protein
MRLFVLARRTYAAAVAPLVQIKDAIALASERTLHRAASSLKSMETVYTVTFVT